MTSPLISVVATYYNYGRFLPSLVHSLCGGSTDLGEFPPQSFPDFELIIVDDGSTDDTQSLAMSYVKQYQNVRYTKTVNNGTAKAHNVGIGMARGEYICPISGDDLMLPGRLETLYNAVTGNPNFYYYDDLQAFAHGERTRVWRLREFDFRVLLYYNMVPVGLIYPKRAWEQANGYPEAMKYGREDWAFAIGLGLAGWYGVHLNGEPGYGYRREGTGRTTRNSSREWNDRFLQQIQSTYPQAYTNSEKIYQTSLRALQRAGLLEMEKQPA